MTSDEVPQQRVRLVVQLPPRPAFFHGTCDFIDPMAVEERPKGSPRNVKYLGSVEWAESPAHSRIDSYYLNPRGSYWLLWIRSQDESDFNLAWKWTLYAYGARTGVDAKAAAIYLLLDAWKAEKEKSFLDHFFLVDEVGFLSVEEILEIARNVWSDDSALLDPNAGSE
jgi:hypothetical protein